MSTTLVHNTKVIALHFCFITVKIRHQSISPYWSIGSTWQFGFKRNIAWWINGWMANRWILRVGWLMVDWYFWFLPFTLGPWSDRRAGVATVQRCGHCPDLPVCSLHQGQVFPRLPHQQPHTHRTTWSPRTHRRVRQACESTGPWNVN